MKAPSYLPGSPRQSRAAATAVNAFRTALGLLLATTAGAADNAGGKQPGHLADLSIEQLLNESVTSVAKKETKLSDSPAVSNSSPRSPARSAISWAKRASRSVRPSLTW